mgnify:CR=1 FL=1
MNNTESQTPINSFTLAELIDLAGEQRQGLMRECITASSDSQMQVFRFPCRIDAFIIGVGTEGETSVSFNLHEFKLKKDSIFIFTPKNVLQVNSQQYFKADVIAISPDFMRRINIDIKKHDAAVPQIRRKPRTDADARREPLHARHDRPRSNAKPAGRRPISRSTSSAD